jgi:ubiquinone/menaquinone biosynthesis C-methylase UbiE
MEEARILAEYDRREREIGNRYSLARPAALFAYQNTQRHIISSLARGGIWPPAELDILDVGCGRGNWLQQLACWGADPERLCGIELKPDRASAARRKLSAADIRQGSATSLPWADGSFDIVMQLVVFTSILDVEMRQQVAREMMRVLKPSGRGIWYDFRINNPRNPNVRGVGLKEIRSLFPGCRVEAKAVALAPPIAEVLAPLSWTLAHAAESLPFLRTHLLATIRHGSAVIT